MINKHKIHTLNTFYTSERLLNIYKYETQHDFNNDCQRNRTKRYIINSHLPKNCKAYFKYIIIIDKI